MATSKSKATSSNVLDAYRQQIIPSDTEQKIADLAVAVATYESNKADRTSQEQALAQRQVEDEDAVFDAYELAKTHGARAAILSEIGLKPEAALVAARGRRKQTPDPESTPKTDIPAIANPAGDPGTPPPQPSTPDAVSA